jgi:hypothetical protein
MQVVDIPDIAASLFVSSQIYMENGSAKGDAKLSYEDSSAAPAAVEWFNGKEYKGKVCVCVSVCAVCAQCVRCVCAVGNAYFNLSTSVPFLVVCFFSSSPRCIVCSSRVFHSLTK